MDKITLTLVNVDNDGQNVDKNKEQIEKKDKRVLNYLLKQRIRCEVQAILDQEFSPRRENGGLDVDYKADHSIVTKIDLLVSSKVKKLLLPQLSGKYTFFSEEDYDQLHFPAVVLDPIDGTKELVRGIPECTLSLAILDSPFFQGEGWIYNPFTSFEIDNLEPFTRPWARRNRPALGFVSQSEWDDGLFQQAVQRSDFVLSPRGSMANKLFLMAVGACEFVITKRPKSLWDIAAGCLILNRQGVKFYQGRQLITSLDQVVYGGNEPLIWARPECCDQVLSYFNSEKLGHLSP